MPSPKSYKLVERLNAQTARGKLNWQETVEKGVYQVSFPSYSIKISSKPSQDGGEEEDYIIVIYNDEGIVVEEFSDVDLVGSDDGPDPAYYKLMSEIYQMARRYAMGTEQALDSILSELEDDEDIPF